ncbi:MAG: gluconolactonase [Rhodospirillales bacterium]|nr:gluconolactonase [Rhodospirillales bacterium]
MTAAEFEILDDRFRPCVRTSARVEHLYEGCRWAEGPAYFPAHHSLVWSDIPNDRMLRFDEMTGAVGIFRAPANYANGNTIDRQGRLVTCEHGGRRVTRTEHDGAITVLADRFEGNRLNSPNDLVVQSNGAIWFTDPSYGIDSNYEGNHAPREQDGCHVYRIDPATGEVERVLDDFVRPNGLAFSPDETRLYVADSGGTSVKDGPRHIRAFTLDDRRLTGGDVFATCTHGFFDGFRLDESGRIWAGTQEGVHCFDPSGDLIGKIRVPETVANLTFGGPKRNRLYLCATTSLYAVFVAVSGAKTI